MGMNSDKENSNRTLAVGWFDNAPFRAICGKYVSRIKDAILRMARRYGESPDGGMDA